MRQRNKPSIDGKKLYMDLIKVYGTKLIQKSFAKNPKAFILLRMTNWTLKITERYSLLGAFLNQPAFVIFDSNPLEDTLESEILKLKDCGIIYDKKFLASKLNLKPYQLNKLTLKYGIDPFWTTNQLNQSEELKASKTSIRVYLTKEEKNEILNFVDEHEHANTSEFVKYCINRVMRQK